MVNTYAPNKPENEIDAEDNQFPVCPHCGFELYEEYWTYEDGDNPECENCGKDFHVKHVIRYTTSKEIG